MKSTTIVLLALALLMLTCSRIFASTPAESLGMVDFTRSNPTLQISRGNLDLTEISLVNPNILWEEVPDGFMTKDVPTITGEPFQLEEGHPMVPQITRLCQIPPTGGVSMQILNAEFDLVENVDVMPYQNEAEASAEQAWCDPNVYYQDAWYPEQTAMISTPQIMRDIRLVGVTLYPVQVNPFRRQARVYRNLQVNLVSNNDTSENELARFMPVSPDWLEMYSALIPNLDESTLDVDPAPGSYLIFYHSGLDQQANDLKLLKTELGYSVTAFQVPGPNGENSTFDLIRNTIHDRYMNPSLPPLEYVCLLGSGFSGSPYYVPTQNPAQCSTQNRGDNFYAVMDNPLTDYFPDIAVGRLPARSPEDAAYCISKINTYEFNPPRDSGWYQNALLYGGTRTLFAFITSTRTLMHWAQSQFARLNPSGTNTFITSLNILDPTLYTPALMDPGAAFFLWRGTHISDHNCGPGVCDLVNVGTNSRFPIAAFITCGTGQYYASGEGGMACTWVIHGSTIDPRGGIAAIGMADFHTETQPDNILMGGLVHAITNLQLRSYGNAMVFAKSELFAVGGDMNHVQPGCGSISFARRTADWANLMGDPSISMWTHSPQTLTFDPYPLSTIPIGVHGMTLTVADSVTLQPVPDVLVVATKDGVCIARQFSNSLGRVNLPLAVVSSGTLNITASKRNCIPESIDMTCTQQPTGYVSFYRTTFDDGTGGDGFMNPSETIKLPIEIKNYGGFSASSIRGTLKCLSNQAVVSTSTCNYPNLASNQSAIPSNGGAFKLTSSSMLSNLDSVVFQLTVSYNTWQSTTSYITLVCHSSQARWNQDPAIPLVDDNADHTLWPGETSHLRISVENMGTVQMTGPVTGTLSCTNGYVQVLNKTGSYGTIPPTGRYTNPSGQFEVYASSCVYPGEFAKMKLILEGNNFSFRDTVYFDLAIGEAGETDPTATDSYGYFAYEKSGDGLDNDRDFVTGDTFTVAAPYEWLDISALGSPVCNMNDPGEELDAVVSIPYNCVRTLPFTFKFYGQPYTQITIASNGWAAFGDQQEVDVFLNYPIPGQQCPDALIAPLWDDLRTLSDGNIVLGVWDYYDATNSRYIIQWEARPAIDRTNEQGPNPADPRVEKFQIVLNDVTDNATPTGDDIVIVHYNDITDPHTTSNDWAHQWASMGIQSVGGASGLSYQYWGTGLATVHPFDDIGGNDHRISERTVTYTTQTEQARSGLSISGTVTDADTEEPLPNMKVSLVGTTYVDLTDANGDYSFDQMRMGTYSIRCEESLPIQGHKPQQVDDQYLACGMALLHNFAMQSGSGGGSLLGLSPNELTMDCAGQNAVATVELSNLSSRDLHYELVAGFSALNAEGPTPDRKLVEGKLRTGILDDEYEATGLLINPASGVLSPGAVIPIQLRINTGHSSAKQDLVLVAKDPMTGRVLGSSVQVHVAGTNTAVPNHYELYQNYPNPFNPSTEIRFDLPEAIRVELKIFNILGQEVATLVDDVRSAGAYQILWDGKNAGGLSVASGVYVYQIKTGNFQDAKKMVLLR